MILSVVPEFGDLGTMSFSFGMSLLFFILQAIPLYAIARRRGIHHAWLAWVPIGNLWILGCVSDQYQYVTRHSIRNKRKKLLTLGLLAVAAAVLVAILSLEAMMRFAGLAAAYFTNQANWVAIGRSLAGLALAAIVLSVLEIVLIVCKYMALYDLFRSCEPENASVYLLISIFTGVGQVILLMSCRNKDKGMPPRKTPVVEQREYRADEEEPWENS